MMMTLITIMMTMLPDTECPFVPFPLMGGSADSEGTAGVMLTIIAPVTPHTDNVGYWLQHWPIILFTFMSTFFSQSCVSLQITVHRIITSQPPGHWSLSAGDNVSPVLCSLWLSTGDIGPGRPGSDPGPQWTQHRLGAGAGSAIIHRSYCGQVSYSGQETWANTSDDVIPGNCFDARIKTLYGGCVSVMESLIERPALAFHDPARLTGALDVRLLDVITGRQNLLMAINNHQITSIAHILASSAHNAAHRGM